MMHKQWTAGWAGLLLLACALPGQAQISVYDGDTLPHKPMFRTLPLPEPVGSKPVSLQQLIDPPGIELQASVAKPGVKSTSKGGKLKTPRKTAARPSKPLSKPTTAHKAAPHKPPGKVAATAIKTPLTPLVPATTLPKTLPVNPLPPASAAFMPQATPAPTSSLPTNTGSNPVNAVNTEGVKPEPVRLVSPPANGMGPATPSAPGSTATPVIATTPAPSPAAAPASTLPANVTGDITPVTFPSSATSRPVTLPQPTASSATTVPAPAGALPVNLANPSVKPADLTATPAALSEKGAENAASTEVNKLNSDPVAPTLQPSRPTRLTADQIKRLNSLQDDISANEHWISDALTLQLAMDTDDMPETALFQHMHDAQLQKRWAAFYRATPHYDQALNRGRQARQSLNTAVALAMPSYRVEGRALWLDRGSIISSQTPEAFKALLKRVHQLGINTVFVETLNAGYPLYKSRILPLNPLLSPDWDPLQVAVETGHQLGMEVHAWVWCFAVGNVRHNAIVNQPPDYAGPVLVEKGMMPEALRGAAGNLIPRKGVQHEYWLSPASQKSRDFLVDVYKEIVTRYGVDGLQLDYIRYPFQNSVNQMGFEAVSRSRFEEETGLYLNSMDDYTLKSFIAWKTFQVTRFVEQVATTLKGINPKLKLSAAVYPMRRQDRIIAIQQDWETWLDKGWLDFLAPMTYTPLPKEYQSTLAYLKTTTQKPSIIYPGIALHRLEGAEVTRLQRLTQELGWQGNTLFANAHLNRVTADTLAQETFRIKPAVPPHRDPAYSARLIIQDIGQLTHAAQQLGDHQFDNWLLTLKQVDDTLANWQKLKLPTQADQLKALQPQIQAMASQCQRTTQTDTPYRMAWMGSQLSRLSHLLGVVARLTDPPAPVANALTDSP